ncbi:MAG: RNA polymerase sigma factor [Lachnospiraceae bacterium]|nr:RNA polymerase sigma factor [Lachnospiraceae bacterium]
MIGMLFTLETEEEQSSFEILYEKTCRRLLYIARGILHNESDAEEIVQDVYVKWAGDFDRYREKSVEEMLRLGVVMTRNACIDLMRRRKSHTEIPIELRDEIFTGEERGTFRGDILDELISKERVSELAQAIRGLSEEEQLLLVLRYDEEYSYKEIAREMKMRTGTVKMRLYRVKRKLKEVLLDE